MDNITERNPRVGLGIGMTVNVGNFQSIKGYISIDLDCLEDTPEEILDYLQEEIIQQLLVRKQEIRDELGV